MLKTKISLLMVLVSSVVLGAQIPSDYSFDLHESLTELVDKQKQVSDVVIPPLERMPLRPSSYSLDRGSFATEWSGSAANHDRISDRASRKVAIFIFDTAPKFDHPALSLAAWNELGRSYTNEIELKDGQGHGHHVAGIIAGVSETAKIGVASALVERGLLKIIPYEVLDDEGSGQYTWIADALNDANKVADSLINSGWVVGYNLSLGGDSSFGPIERALNRANEIGVFICVAAGNTYRGGIQFPARLSSVSAIGSIDQNGQRSNFSSYGQELFITAPGRDILSTWPGGGLVELSGTSMSAPVESAIMGIASSVHPTSSPDRIHSILIQTATDIDPDGWDDETGYGYNFIGRILDLDIEEDSVGLIPSRRISVVMPGPYEIMYQSGEGLFATIELSDIEISFKSKERADQAWSLMKKQVESFFYNRAVTVKKKEDAFSAGYWVGRFLEIHLKKTGIKANVKDSIVTSKNGATGKPDKPSLFDLITMSARRTFSLS